MKASSERRRVSGDGRRKAAGGVPLRVEPPRGRRRIRLPQVLIGVLVVAVSALLGVLLVASATERQPVLVLSQPVERGQQLTAADLQVAYLATDDVVATLPEVARGELVGQVATANLAAGTVVTRGQFAPGTKVADGQGVVGLALGPGAYPVDPLHIGDRVSVVRADDPTIAGEEVLVEDAEVFAISEGSTSGGRVVSLVMGRAEAERVASAAAAGTALRLVLVGP